ncbi:MAG TPA: hypothetical protein VHE33_20570, partial [Acidobacteriaceae bacterium]|nr:hypothetical protein [Acidobacteriaceae bacterium]
MRKLLSLTLVALALLLAAPVSQAQTGSAGNTLVLVFKDGHRQRVNLNDLQRLEFPGPVPAGIISTPGPSRARFLGRWEVGEGNGSNFFITL